MGTESLGPGHYSDVDKQYEAIAQTRFKDTFTLVKASEEKRPLALLAKSLML